MAVSTIALQVDGQRYIVEKVLVDLITIEQLKVSKDSLYKIAQRDWFCKLSSVYIPNIILNIYTLCNTYSLALVPYIYINHIMI